MVSLAAPGGNCFSAGANSNCVRYVSASALISGRISEDGSTLRFVKTRTLLLILAASSLGLGCNEQKDSQIISEEDPPKLARWAESGSDEIRTDGTSDTGTIEIIGQPAGASRVRVEVQAQLGSLRTVLADRVVDVPAAEIVIMPVDFRSALSLDEAQADYLTQVSARITVVHDDRRPGNSEHLASLFLVVGSEKSRLITNATKKHEFPSGITNPALAEQLRRVETFAPDEGINLGYGPGIAISEPLGRAVRPSDN